MKYTKPAFQFIVLLICAIPLAGHAQWESIEGPYGGSISTLAKNDQYVFAGTNDGLFRSTDGHNWQSLSIIPGKRTGCPFFDVLDNQVLARVTILEPGHFSTALYLSQDSGNTWEKINNPPINMFGLYVTDAGYYCFDFYTLWFSGDQGMQWQPSTLQAKESEYFHCTKVDRQLLVGGLGGVYISQPDADDFSKISLPDTNALALSSFVDDSLILAMAPYSQKLYRSTDFGAHWTWIESERWYHNITANFAKVDTTYFLKLDSVVLVSNDEGQVWNESSSLYYSSGFTMLDYHHALLVGTHDHGVLRSDDKAETFYPATLGITSSYVKRLEIKDGKLIAASLHGSIMDYDPLTGIWDYHYNSPLLSFTKSDLINYNNSLYVSDGRESVYRFTDSTQSWHNISNAENLRFKDFTIFDQQLYVNGDGLKKWNEQTQFWEAVQIQVTNQIITPEFIAADASFVYVATEENIYRKDHEQINAWEPIFSLDTATGLNPRIKGIYNVKDQLFLVTHLPWGDFHEHSIITSFDHGLTWIRAEENFPLLSFEWWTGIDQVKDIAGYAFANAYSHAIGVSVSAPGDNVWQSFNEGLPTLFINDFAINGDYIYAATLLHGVWRRKISDLETVSADFVKENPAIPFAFPNPASDLIFLQNNPDIENNALLALSDLQGKTIFQTLIQAGQTVISTSQIPAGFYVLTLQSDRKVLTQKVIIQH